MEFFEIRCPNCNSKLSCEDGYNTYICPYCESEFILDDDTKIEARRLDVKEHVAELKYKETQTKTILKYKSESQSNNIVVFIILIFIVMAIGMIIASSISDQKEVEELGYKPGNLNSMVKRAQELISLNEFDEAEVIINQLYYDGSFFDFADKKTWNETRKTLEKQLKAAEKAYEAEQKAAEKAAKLAEKAAEKEAKQAEKEDSNFWSFLPWVD